MARENQAEPPGSRPGSRSNFDSGAIATGVHRTADFSPPTPRPCRVALTLALAYKLEQAIVEGGSATASTPRIFWG